MEITKNKEFEFEADDYLWRYIDLHKLFSLLLEEKMFFTRLDKFNDPLEGLTNKILAHMTFNDGMPKDKKALNPIFTDDVKTDILNENTKREAFIKKETDKSQKTQFASCWFVGKKESFAMWNLYSNKDGVVLRYNPKSLIENITNSAILYNGIDFEKFIYGLVEYEDIWPFDVFQEKNSKIIYTAFKKDKSYIHEREFRFVSVVPCSCIGKYDKFELPFNTNSEIDFKIFANPYMESWKFNNLRKLLNEKFNIAKLEQSNLKVK